MTTYLHGTGSDGAITNLSGSFNQNPHPLLHLYHKAIPLTISATVWCEAVKLQDNSFSGWTVWYMGWAECIDWELDGDSLCGWPVWYMGWARGGDSNISVHMRDKKKQKQKNKTWKGYYFHRKACNACDALTVSKIVFRKKRVLF